MKIFAKTFYWTFLLIALFESLSLLAHFFHLFNVAGFFVLVIAVLAVGFFRLEYAFYILFAELLIGSLGKLFVFDFQGREISIRIGIWLSLMAVYFVKELFTGIRNLKAKKNLFDYRRYLHNPIVLLYSGLFVFIAWGALNGFWQGNGGGNIFFDFNGWLFFLLLFPALRIFQNGKNVLGGLYQVFFAAIVWISIKTFALLFIFSHNMLAIAPDVYTWIRDTRIGEITAMESGFYRIFFQSHIFVLAGFFVCAFWLVVYYVKQASIKTAWFSRKFYSKSFFTYFTLLSVFLSVSLISFSRSNWVGLAAGAAVLFVLILRLAGIKKSIILSGFFLLSFVFALGIMSAVVKFPYPDSSASFNTAELLSERAGTVSGEAGVSSRWSLLPELWGEIKEQPILGQGFGATVTYVSSDPRVLENNPDGLYTTYAFEWGWLDIWLKLGFFGLMAYISLLGFLLIKIFLPILKTKDSKINNLNQFLIPLGIGLIVIAVISFFSPYLNHPLGIGYLVVLSVLVMGRGEEKTESTEISQ